MQPATFVLQNLLAATTAIALADRLMPDDPPHRRALAAVAGFPLITWAVLAGLGTAGFLSAGPVIVVLALLCTTAVWAAYLRHGAPAHSPPAAAPQHTTQSRAREETVPGDRTLTMIVLVSFGALAGIAVTSGALLGTRFVWDDLSYHAPTVAHWYADHRLTLAPFWYQAYYPLNPEVLSLWFFLPLGADAYVSLAGLYWLTLAVTAACLIACAHAGTTAGLLAGAVILASHVVTESASTFSATDLAGPACILAAMAFLLPAHGPRGDTSPRLTAASLFYAGLLAGFAAGCKVPFVPVCLLFALWIALRPAGAPRITARLRAVGLFLLCALVTGSYWYVRNAVLTGNPVFPAEVGPFAGPFYTEAQHRTRLLAWLTDHSASTREWVRAVAGYVWWPLGPFIVSAVGLALGVSHRIRRRLAPRPAQRAAYSLLLLTALVMLILYPFTPFSGTADDPGAELKPFPRYLIAPFITGVVLFSLSVNNSRRWRPALWALAILALVTALPLDDRFRSHVLAGDVRAWFIARAIASTAGVLGGGLALFVASRRVQMMIRRRPRLVGAAALTVVLTGLAAWAPHKQRLTDASLYAYGPERGPIGDVWRSLEDLPAGARIAWFGSEAYQYYATFGRHAQLTPSHVGQDGRPGLALHERWREDPATARWWATWGRPLPDMSALVENLHAADIGYVLDTKWASGAWPAQHKVLSESADARAVYDDGYSVVWKVTRPILPHGPSPAK